MRTSKGPCAAKPGSGVYCPPPHPYDVTPPRQSRWCDVICVKSISVNNHSRSDWPTSRNTAAFWLDGSSPPVRCTPPPLLLPSAFHQRAARDTRSRRRGIRARLVERTLGWREDPFGHRNPEEDDPGRCSDMPREPGHSPRCGRTNCSSPVSGRHG